MIRASRPGAMAQDDASMLSGWNVAPNLAYTLRLLPGSASCGVLLYDETGTTLIATGAALVGTAQPCVLLPQTGQTVGMVDADLGWHLLLTTTGTESQRTIRIGPAVDLPDEIHPVYGADDLALARATAAIDAAAHYIDAISTTCPNGLGAGLGAVVSVPVDGAALKGQAEGITWTATPNGAIEASVIRRHVAIAPEPFVEPSPPPVVANDAAETDADTAISGNVLENDESGLDVVAVNGLAANVGIEVAGSAGGVFVIDESGDWTFDPDGDFAELSGEVAVDTSVTYHASDGVSEASATLTVTVSAVPGAIWDISDTASAQWLDLSDVSVVTVSSGALAGCLDKSGNNRHATQANALYRAAQSGPMCYWDGSNDYQAISVPQSIPCHIFFILDLTNTLTGIRQLLGRSTGTAPYPPAIYLGGQVSNRPEFWWGNNWLGAYSGAISGRVLLEAILTPTQAGFRVNGGAAVLTSHSQTVKSTWTDIGASYAPQAGKFGLGESVIVNAAVGDDLRWHIEGRLAHKWDELLGITDWVDSLPSSHPYKSTPPPI